MSCGTIVTFVVIIPAILAVVIQIVLSKVGRSRFKRAVPSDEFWEYLRRYIICRVCWLLLFGSERNRKCERSQAPVEIDDVQTFT